MPHIRAERRLERRQLCERLQTIQRAIYRPLQPIEKIEAAEAGKGHGPTTMPTSGWRPFKVMDRWGAHDLTTWFRFSVTVPKAFKGERVAAIIRICDATHVKGIGYCEESGEGVAYVNGVPRQGLDRNHHALLLAEKAKGGERFEIAIEGVASTRFETTHQLSQADLAVVNPLVWDFYWDVRAALDVAELLDEDAVSRKRLELLIFEAMDLVDFQAEGEAGYFPSIAKAQKHLRKGLAAFPSNPGDGKMCLVGHSHIDTAWLWPLRETRRKVGRTWGTVLRLMEQYPEYHFSASQPQLYAYCKEHFPGHWKEIKKRVKEGRWEICGATWVEQDSNVPRGESLVRQFLYGNRFYEKEFGLRSRVAWLPDAFGFPWSLPQIMKQCQIDTFYTIKITWSRFTEFPYNYFMWQGADGSRVRAVLGSTKNYNGFVSAEEMQDQWRKFKQHDLCEEMVYSFGWGDGGGGPTAEMLERGKRFKNITGVPQSTFGRTQDTFERMHAHTPAEKLPVHNGELYLEYHRGCQTTQALTKYNNRKCELLLKNAELLGSMALICGGRYDQASLYEAWKIVLTHQFHDILPGSSITQVYDDANENYDEARRYIAKAHNRAQDHLVRNIDTSGQGDALVLFNPLSWVRDDVVRAEAPLPRGNFHVTAPNGEAVLCQKVGKNAVVFEARGLPPLGYAVYRIVKGKAETEATGTLRVSEQRIENDYLRVRLDKHGRFTSVYDKLEGREALAKGEKGNVLQLFDDRPPDNDAWDIEHNFENKMWEAGPADSIEVIEEGPVRAVIRVVQSTAKSVITRDIVMHAASPRIDVVCHADWHEERTLLKVAFPVAVLSTRATYEIQYATTERATHRNTDFDRARFEVPAQQWADLSEGNYGVSLLNDCKYGYDVRDNMLRLSLLRAPVDPDSRADRGEHDFVYSLYPHGGDWRTGTVQEAHELNQPVLAVATKASKGDLSPVHAFASVDTENVILDAVKKAEDSNAIVLRLYEAYGQRGPAEITFGDIPKEVAVCDMMEENEAPLKLHGNAVKLEFSPYEIKTLIVAF